MPMRGENWRFWLPVLGLLVFSVYSTFHLVCAHLNPEVDAPDYVFSRQLLARRGSIYSAQGNVGQGFRHAVGGENSRVHLLQFLLQCCINKAAAQQQGAYPR